MVYDTYKQHKTSQSIYKLNLQTTHKCGNHKLKFELIFLKTTQTG